jgi:hypothetical protein
MKRKELEAAGFSASEIDERLPFPRNDDDETNKKRLRQVVKTEEETYISSSGQDLKLPIDCNYDSKRL